MRKDKIIIILYDGKCIPSYFHDYYMQANLQLVFYTQGWSYKFNLMSIKQNYQRRTNIKFYNSKETKANFITNLHIVFKRKKKEKNQERQLPISILMWLRPYLYGRKALLQAYGTIPLWLIKKLITINYFKLQKNNLV